MRHIDLRAGGRTSRYHTRRTIRWIDFGRGIRDCGYVQPEQGVKILEGTWLKHLNRWFWSFLALIVITSKILDRLLLFICGDCDIKVFLSKSAFSGNRVVELGRFQTDRFPLMCQWITTRWELKELNVIRIPIYVLCLLLILFVVLRACGDFNWITETYGLSLSTWDRVYEILFFNVFILFFYVSCVQSWDIVSTAASRCLERSWWSVPTAICAERSLHVFASASAWHKGALFYIKLEFFGESYLVELCARPGCDLRLRLIL